MLLDHTNIFQDLLTDHFWTCNLNNDTCIKTKTYVLLTSNSLMEDLKGEKTIQTGGTSILKQMKGNHMT